MSKTERETAGTVALFDCQMLTTKVLGFVSERKQAVEWLKFVLSEEKLIGGHDGKYLRNTMSCKNSVKGLNQNTSLILFCDSVAYTLNKENLASKSHSSNGKID